MRIVDAHLDLAWNGVGLGRDITRTVDQARDDEAGSELAAREGEVTVTLPELRRGGASVVFGTLFVLPCGSETTMIGQCYRDAEEAHAQAQGQLAHYRELERAGWLRLVDSRAALEAALAEGALALVPLIEGADPIRTPEELAEWHAAGVRLIGPAWQGTRYCGGTGQPGPLTDLGRQLLREMRRLGLALDLSHLAEESFWQALELFDGPVMASHANSRALVPTDRHLSDAMIRAIAERDGVIGVLPFSGFLLHEWSERREEVGLSRLIEHIDHICDVIGDRAHIGIGSDFDGGFGRQGIPHELDRWGDLPALLSAALLERGWSEPEVAGLLGENWLRWLRAALPS